MTTNHHTDERTPLPADLAGLDARLARLGRVEREGAPASLEDRLALATMPGRSAAARRGGVLARIGPASGPVRIAAGLALAAGAAWGVWRAAGNAGTAMNTPAKVEAEFAALEADLAGWAGALEVWTDSDALALGDALSALEAGSEPSLMGEGWIDVAALEGVAEGGF